MSNDDLFFAGVSDPVRFREAIRRFDELNAADPNQEIVDGVARPRELVFAERLSRWVMALAPDAPETLRIASRCQHLCRWMIPRRDYEMTRGGYLRWRADLKQFHAGKSAAVLEGVGYPPEIIHRVSALNLKKNFPADLEVCALEDALCLVFLQFQFADLARKTDEEKVINALRKSWGKMTPRAREQALHLDYADSERALLEKALKG